MADIVLCTANARYAHASLGLRCLLANLGPWQSQAALLEGTLEDRPNDIVERLLCLQPRIVGLGVYIWNVELLGQVAAVLRRVAPQITVVMGGPEVSFPADLPDMAAYAHHIICGEAEQRFASLCAAVLGGDPAPTVLSGSPPELAELASPYGWYDEADLAHRWTYIETTRGCPHGCEFCLSSLDRKVRRFPQEATAAALGQLLARGARRLKVLDRTVLPRQLRMLLEVVRPYVNDGLFLHLEAVPDRLSDQDILSLAELPPGVVQIEAGIQTLDPVVSDRIGRKQRQERALHTLARLVRETGVHVHADLVVGLPGETMDSLAQGFDTLFATGVHEIQIGILKRLRGAPIDRHSETYALRFAPVAPYEILATSTIDFAAMQRLRRLSRVFDLIHNSGRFRQTTARLLEGRSPFNFYLELAESIHRRAGRTVGLSLSNLAGLVFDHATLDLGREPRDVAEDLASDLERTSREAPPPRIRELLDPNRVVPRRSQESALPQRQRRHRDG